MKYGGAEGKDWCEREFQEEAGEESVKVSWTRRPNGLEENSKTKTDMGGLCEDRFGGSGKGERQ